MSAISTNLPALQSAFTLDSNQDLLNSSITSLSSGSKNNSVADDPVGVGVANALSSQNQRLSAAATNIQTAISYTQASDSLLSNIGDMFGRMSQLVDLAQDPTQSSADAANYQQEFQSLQTQLRHTIGGTTAEIGGTSDISSPVGAFNGLTLFASSGYQVALGGSAAESMTIPATNLRTGAVLNLIQQDSSGNYLLNLSSTSAADLTAAIQQVAACRATIGATQSRLTLASSKVQTESQNIASAISQINDVDVASASTALAKYNVLVQADAAMLAQANTTSASVLKLLKN
jgi:flagellin